MKCPRQAEATLTVQREHQTRWETREGFDTCSYCGSLSPAELFTAIAAGAELLPTDKSYKLYVLVKNPNAGKRTIDSVSNVEHPMEGYVPATPEVIEEAKQLGWTSIGPQHQVRFSTEREVVQKKFYFQHFSEEEARRFCDLYNARKLNIGYPGHFYRLPYFMRPVDTKPEAQA